MIGCSGGNLHDIDHFFKVYALTETIGEREGLDGEPQTALEAAAVLHDIACPLCRERYGNTDGKRQEREGVPLAAAFLEGSRWSQARIDWVVYLTTPPKGWWDLTTRFCWRRITWSTPGRAAIRKRRFTGCGRSSFAPPPAPPCSTKSIWRADCGPCRAGAEGAHPFIRKDFSPGGGGEPPRARRPVQKRRRAFSCRNRSR